MSSNQWLTTHSPQARLRLFCLPYAGAGATLYRLWPNQLPPEIDVCPIHLPGRETRWQEPAFIHLSPLVQALAGALQPYLDRPFAFFGYSMGALISFELARYLRRTNAPQPAHLFVAAHRAPQLPQSHPFTHHLPERAFLDSLSRLGGIPTAIFEHPELLKLLLPTLRADFTLCETYSYTDEALLACPITAFGGEQDTLVSTADLDAWHRQTTQAFALHLLPGNHLFLHTQQALLLQIISHDLANLFENTSTRRGNI